MSLGKESISYTMIKLDKKVLKGVNWIHSDKKIRCQMVLKGVNWVHGDKNQAIWS